MVNEPNNEPSINLIILTFLFSIKDEDKSNIKSNIKFVINNTSRYIFIFITNYIIDYQLHKLCRKKSKL